MERTVNRGQDDAAASGRGATVAVTEWTSVDLKQLPNGGTTIETHSDLYKK